MALDHRAKKKEKEIGNLNRCYLNFDCKNLMNTKLELNMRNANLPDRFNQLDFKAGTH